MATQGSIHNFLKMQAAAHGLQSAVQATTQSAGQKSRAGKPWSPEEEATILDYVSQGMTIKDIAELQGRSPTAITLRLKSMAVEMYKSGESLEEVVQKTGLTAAEVTDSIRDIEMGAKPGLKNTASGLTFEQGAKIIALLEEIRDLTLKKE